MTQLIGAHQVPCLDDNDYAAYALYMQCLAEQVENRLTENLVAAQSVLNRPVRVWRYTDSLGSGSSATLSPRFTLFDAHYPSVFSATTPATLNLRGWWRVGFSYRCTTTSFVSNPHWIVSLAAFPPNTPSSQIGMDTGAWTVKVQDITWEYASTAGGGESLYSSVDFYNPGDPTVGVNEIGMRILVAAAVEFATPETVTFTGNVWAIYLGDTPSINI